MRVVCVLCLVLAAAWCAKVALVPVWIGRLHSPVDVSSTEWFPSGVFALKDGVGVRANAPIWDPPPPYAENIQARPRWPWQPVTRREHVEIDVSALVRGWALAIITLGAVLGVARIVLDRRTHHGCVTMWWSVTLALTAAWLALLGLAVFTHGYAPTETFDVGVLTVAAAVGGVVGVVRHRRARAEAADVGAA